MGAIPVPENAGVQTGVVRIATADRQLLGQLRVVGYGMDFVLARNDDHAIELLRANKVQAIYIGWLAHIARHPISRASVG